MRCKDMINHIFKSHLNNEKESLAFEATKKAREARDIANKKIEDIYAQLDGHGDKWFLIPSKTMDECNEKSTPKENGEEKK